MLFRSNMVFTKAIHRTNGVADGWAVNVLVHGTSINDIIFANLSTLSFYGLTNVGGGDFEFTKTFGSKAAMDAEFQDARAYQFYFNQNHPAVTFEDQAIIGYVANIPQGYANITNPTHLETGVSLNPTYQWDNAAGVAGTDVLGLWVLQGTSSVFEVVPELNKGLTSWQPGVLGEGTAYEFQVGLMGLQKNPAGGYPIVVTPTIAGDSFDFFGVYEQGNSVDFTTLRTGQEVPEPGTLALFGSAVLTLIGYGWRRGMK